MQKQYTVGSLFAGVGGIDKGFEYEGAKVIWANEVDKNAAITYKLNFDNDLIEEDIRKIHEFEMPNVDIIVAGWPCVAFSVAGKRHGMAYKCNECQYEHIVTYDEYIHGAQCPDCSGDTKPKDDRGTLFYDIVRFIREKQPKAIMLENVSNLFSHDNGNTIKVIEQMLSESGYDDKILKYEFNTLEYSDLPQNRERAIIVAFKDKVAYNNFSKPTPNNYSSNKSIDEVLERNQKQEEKYYYNEASQYYEMLKEKVKNYDTVYQLRRVYVRENKRNVCPTLTANMGTGGHNVPIILDDWGIRKITPKEAFKLQGFEIGEDYNLPNIASSHLYKQAGNSVSIPVIRKVANSILSSLYVADELNEVSQPNLED